MAFKSQSNITVSLAFDDPGDPDDPDDPQETIVGATPIAMMPDNIVRRSKIISDVLAAFC
ncbi:MAG TPA: hypothetical protein VNR70_15955 [Steroidobacteraceae bacterium]|nr:hypothetical protein [Steroidobacteraceae bacterium]